MNSDTVHAGRAATETLSSPPLLRILLILVNLFVSEDLRSFLALFSEFLYPVFVVNHERVLRGRFLCLHRRRLDLYSPLIHADHRRQRHGPRPREAYRALFHRCVDESELMNNRRTCGLAWTGDRPVSTEDCARAILSRWGASEKTFKHCKDRHPLHYYPGFKLPDREASG